MLKIKPVTNSENTSGIKNISFGGNLYSFLFDGADTYLLSEYEAAVKLELSGFKKEQKVRVVTVKDGIISAEETVIADDNGKVLLSKRFGNNSYLKLSAVEEKK